MDTYLQLNVMKNQSCFSIYYIGIKINTKKECLKQKQYTIYK